jgi:Spy/CpxP family protein refolding chaperone
MKASKMSLAVLLALALTAGLAASSWAGPWGGGWGGGWGCAMNLTPDQAGKLFDLRQKFMDDTAKLRKQMMVTRIDLAGLWNANKPDEKAIVAKQKELNALRGQMQEKMVAFRLAARQVAPQFGQGFGPGMGPGWGHGRGGPGGYYCPHGGPGPGAPPAK